MGLLNMWERWDRTDGTETGQTGLHGTATNGKQYNLSEGFGKDVVETSVMKCDCGQYFHLLGFRFWARCEVPVAGDLYSRTPTVQ